MGTLELFHCRSHAARDMYFAGTNLTLDGKSHNGPDGPRSMPAIGD